jgi:aspartate racemase
MASTLGILGGMGPLASAEFLRTLYRLNLAEREQCAPVCVLLSDPSVPDRTDAILAGDVRELTARLEAALEQLLASGADRIVIACVTMHYVLPRLPERLRRRVINLLDLIVDGVLDSPRPRLLLATTGTRAGRVLESHARWCDIAPWLVSPGDDDQRQVHEWIYRLKTGAAADDCLSWLDCLADRYDVDGFVYGCTEFHLVSGLRAAAPARDWDVIDPLWIAASELRSLLVASDQHAVPQVAQATGE